MLKDMNIDCSLLNEYTKWNLYKNGELIYNGNFSPKFDGNVLTDNIFSQNVEKMKNVGKEYFAICLYIFVFYFIV